MGVLLCVVHDHVAQDVVGVGGVLRLQEERQEVAKVVSRRGLFMG